MNSSSSFASPFRLGEWLVVPELNRVVGPEGEVQLEPRVMLVLVRLAADPGAVVGRQALLDEVWGETIVGEENLTRAISDLRRIFGDQARRPRYVETIRHHGYRLIATVEPATLPPAATPEPAAPAPVTPPPAVPEPPPPPRRTARPAPTILLAVLAVVVLAAAALWFWPRSPVPEGASAGLPAVTAGRAVPLTSFPGHERHPALSPDGSRVAFAWGGPEDGAPAIWVKQRNSEQPLRLSNASGWAAWPAWAPDGQSVAWVQVREGSSDIRTVPSLGGADRVLVRLGGTIAGLDWSPRGDVLVFSARDSVTGRHRLHRLDLENLAVRLLPLARPGGVSDVQPRFDPAGDRLAWIGLEAGGGAALWTADADGQGPRRLMAGLADLVGVAWRADGAGLVVAGAPADVYHLWAVDAGGDGVRPLLEATGFAWNPSIARETGDLVFEQVRVESDFWRVRILATDPWRLETGSFLASTRWEYEADFSPDGQRIAFVSARSGPPALWLADADGTRLRQLAEAGGEAMGQPRWSPDGRRLAFNVLGGRRARVRVVPAEGGPAVELTPPDASEFLAGWSSDGASLLVSVPAGDHWYLHRRPLEPGPAGDLVRRGVVAAVEDGGGDLLFVQASVPGLWRAPADDPDAPPREVVPGLAPADRRNWRLVGDQLFWTMRTGGSAFLMVQDLGTGLASVVTDLPGLTGSGLAVAPDGRTVIYPRTGVAEGDLMLLPAVDKAPTPSS